MTMSKTIYDYTAKQLIDPSSWDVPGIIDDVRADTDPKAQAVIDHLRRELYRAKEEAAISEIRRQFMSRAASDLMA